MPFEFYIVAKTFDTRNQLNTVLVIMSPNTTIELQAIDSKTM
jgi:hypothetical protein